MAQQQKSGCQLIVYCVMPDHLHLIVSPLTYGCSTLAYVARFKGWCSRELHRAGFVGRVWQPRSYDHLIRRDEDVQAIAAYILGNPVRSGLCTHADNYPWSGIPEPIEP